MKEEGSPNTPTSDLDLSIFNQSESLEPLHVRFRESTLEIISDISQDEDLSKAKVVRKLTELGLRSLSSQVSVKEGSTEHPRTSNPEFKGRG